MLKRFIDLSLVIIGMVPALPLAALIAIAIKLDSPGPVLFIQDRLGKGQRLFRCHKFRTMRCGVDGPCWTVQDDPRVTSVGRVLRALHLDELPQMVNVMRGEMSIVGPRPIVAEEAVTFGATQPPYNLRFSALPGITGLAQITVPADAHLEKFRLDVFYVSRQSVPLDLWIMLRTMVRLLRLDVVSRRRARRPVVESAL